MGTSIFKAGAALKIEGKLATLLRKIGDDVWQVEDERTKRITESSMTALHELYLAGKLTFAGGSPDFSGVTPTLSPYRTAMAKDSDWTTAKLRRLYVLAVLSLPTTEADITRAVQEVWAKAKEPARAPGFATVYRWKARYLAAGKDIRALFPQNFKKGNTKARYSAEVEKIVEEAIEARYLSEERCTIQATLDSALAAVIKENKLRPESMQLAWPTRRLVKRTISAIPAFDQYAARHGRTLAVKRFRSVLAHRTTMAPMERAEIDHTPLDLMVIDDKTGLPLGRPYITACIDDYTRCVLGLYISFEPPSHFTVSRCLKQVFMPKGPLLKQYPDIQNQWEAHGVMRDLVVDNGKEFHSPSLENACYTLGIEIHYSPRKTAWFKGKIERFLGTLNREISHNTPGTTFSNIFDKEDYDPSKNAIVRYSVLKEIIYTWITDVYHQQLHRTLGAPPSVVWARSISPEDIMVPDDPAQLDCILGRSVDRVLTHKGIELYGLTYNSHELTNLRRKLGDKLEVEVKLDSSDLGHVFVISPDKTQTFRVPSINLEYAEGLSDWQHKVCKRFAAREDMAYSSAAWLEAKARIRELVENEFVLKKQRTRNKETRFKNMDADIQSSRPVPSESASEDPPRLSKPVPQTTFKPVKPVVSVEMTHDVPVSRALRFKPVLRERTASAISQEQDEST